MSMMSVYTFLVDLIGPESSQNNILFPDYANCSAKPTLSGSPGDLRQWGNASTAHFLSHTLQGKFWTLQLHKISQVLQSYLQPASTLQINLMLSAIASGNCPIRCWLLKVYLQYFFYQNETCVRDRDKSASVGTTYFIYPLITWENVPQQFAY